MLGTVGDAEDIVQEAFLRLQRELESGEQIASPDAFVATVVTRLAIDELRSARAQRERYVGEWLPEPLVTGSEAASVHPQPAHRAPEAGTPRRRATHPVALTMPYVAYGRMGANGKDDGLPAGRPAPRPQAGGKGTRRQRGRADPHRAST
ncbi:MAG: sigma factor [Thermoleophilaceae bacterium]